MNAGKTYGKEIKKISLKVNNFIIHKIKSKNLSTELENFLLSLPQKRKYNGIMRSFLTYIVYKNLGGDKDLESIMPLLAISELSNYYAYLDNWIFDNKNNCNNDVEKIKLIIISSAIFRELCQECLEESNLDPDKKRDISQRLAQASYKSYLGQFQDIRLTIEKIKFFKKDKDYFEYYENKSKLASGFFYGLSFEIGAIISNINSDLVDKISSFGMNFGTALHISNDLGDFSLFSKENTYLKQYQDQLADLSNKRLTLPIYLVLKYGNKSEVTSLKDFISFPKNHKYKIKVSKTIVSSGCFHRILNFLKNKEKLLKNEIKIIFPQNQYRDMLDSTIGIITTNKYLKYFKEIKIKKIIHSQEKVIFIDKNNSVLGFEEKMIAHKNKKLHRAVSIIIFNSKGEMLIQKRNSMKYHSGGLWSNAACTHPLPKETIQQSAKRRLFEEMGIKTKLKEVFSFIYKTPVSKDLFEHELDFVFVGIFEGEPEINIKEVEDYRWISLEELKLDMKKFPSKYSSWFKIIMQNDYFNK